MEPLKIIEKYYVPDSDAYRFLVEHSRMVAKKAVEVAEKIKNLNPDIEFIREAAMLHDIGIFMTNAPQLGCHGDKPYICHGYLGRELLEKEGLPMHAIVCETHVGLGLTIQDIEKNNFPIPKRDMTPKTIEEQIICFADKFFSKDNEPLKEKPIQKIREFIGKFGEAKLRQFDEWLIFFKGPK
ncbi:MAG: HD domain-containing protein [Nitrospirae bacterium]|nr:MAG: HD domain-containing protein [Nitrospirota bacterium]